MTQVRSMDDYREILRDLKRIGDADLAIDLETTGLKMHQDDVVRGISLAYRHDFTDEVISWYLPVSHPGADRNFNPRRLIQAFNRHRGVQVFHNAVGVDWTGLEQCGPYKLPKHGRYYDTQVGSFLHDENEDHRLKQLGAVYFGEDAKAEQNHIKELRKGRGRGELYKELRQTEEWGAPHPAALARAEAARLSEESKKTWATYTADDLAAYASRDAELTLMLKEAQQRHGDVSPAALEREHRFQYVLHRMMKRGVRVNPEEAHRQWREAEERLAELAAPYAGIYPPDKTEPINLASVDQLAWLLYEEWGLPVHHRSEKTGKPSTAKAALEEHKGDPRIRDLMEFRRHSKAVSGYYKPLTETIAADGRIHASFSSTRTTTGRLTCGAPNLMTIPRGDTLEGVRDLFEPDDGYELWEYDLVSAELYVQASFTGDLDQQRALEAGEDMHDRTAAQIWGPDFLPINRRDAKAVNYGFSYGMGPKKLAIALVESGETMTQCKHWTWERWDRTRRPGRCKVCHICRAAEILDGYREANPKLVQLMKGLERVAKEKGVLPLHVDGRFRHFRSPGKLVHYFTALNAVVQGGVAETVKSNMIDLEPILDDLGAHLCLQVHDSYVVEVLPGTGPAVGQAIQQVSDDLDHFAMRMLWTAQPWAAHD